mmetsp:Transcript_34960/g.54646  ORF Transcript_34960/g.54646 Transcript_34960/m.54646 type:complete len:483 (+) Transcript_34960:1231-2679(+)
MIQLSSPKVRRPCNHHYISKLLVQYLYAAVCSHASIHSSCVKGHRKYCAVEICDAERNVTPDSDLAFRPLNQISHIHRHLLDLRVVELLDIPHVAHVVASDEVDGNTLTTETAGTTNPVDVILPVGGEVVVDDQGNLLDVNATSQQVGGDQHTGGSGTELAHDKLTTLLVHIPMKSRDGEVTLGHLVQQPVHLTPSVDVDDGLSDGESLVEIAKGVQLPVLTLNTDVELLDTLEGKLVLLHEDANRVPHEVPGDLKHLHGHGGGEQANLHLGGQKLEHVIDLVLEATGKHLVSLVKSEDLHLVGPKGATVDHVMDTARGADNNILARLQLPDILPNIGTTDASVALNLHIVSKSEHHLLDLLGKLTGRSQNEGLAILDIGVNPLQASDGEGSSLSGTGLSLSNGVPSLDQGQSTTLLDSRRLLETVGKDATEQVLIQAHVIESLADLVPVGLDIGISESGVESRSVLLSTRTLLISHFVLCS